MFPYFEIFGRYIYMYSILAIVGIFAAGIYFCIRIKHNGLDDNDAIVFLLITGIGAFIGAHLLYAITQIRYIKYIFDSNNFNEFQSSFVRVFGGMVFYGGLIGGIVAGLIWIKIKNLDYQIYIDNMASAVPLLHAISRIGCFFGGCCYGISCKYGVTFHGNKMIPELNDIPRFPVQLLESLCEFIIFFILFILVKKGKYKGKLFPLYLILYSLVRFGDEYLRGDNVRGFVLGLSTSQFISVLIFICGIIWFFCNFERKEAKSNE